MNKIDTDLLETIADMHGVPQGAYNIRKDGKGIERHSTANIIITPKTDKPGIDILIKPFTKNESVHIPVIITQTGLSDLVYNDFEIGEYSDVLIVAGCGIHNDGNSLSQHDGIHRFHLNRGARLRYVEKHYGEGNGLGKRILNPQTYVTMEEGCYCEMEMVQIKGVDSTKRETFATVGKDSKIFVMEKLLTHGQQRAQSNMEFSLNGENSSAQVVSRSVAKEKSSQVFNPRVIGNTLCKAHVQCDSIIMDSARVRSIPELCADSADAQLIHEAAIGRINNDQIVKLMTFGMDEKSAEEVIINGFLK